MAVSFLPVVEQLFRCLQHWSLSLSIKTSFYN